MNYKSEFEKAVRETWELGLPLHGKPLPFIKDTIPKNNVLSVMAECADILELDGYISSKELSGNCIPVHLRVKRLLMNLFGLESHITIGSMHGENWAYCPMSYAYIREELKSPNINSELKAHIWLTLPDGSLIDWTGQAWYDQQIGETYELRKCLLHLGPNELNHEHYYKPYLVGEEFLIRTGTMKPVF